MKNGFGCRDWNYLNRGYGNVCMCINRDIISLTKTFDNNKMWLNLQYKI